MTDTPVLFRIDTRGEFKGQVTAVFPTIPAGPGLMTCYSHTGQHAGCSWLWWRRRSHRPATAAEYAPLRRELESGGYKLKVYRRITAKHRDSYERALRKGTA